jgi:hypothetical protein
VSATPPCADTGGPGPAVPSRWLGVNTRSEDRRKDDRGGYRVPGYRPSIVVRHEGRSGEDRRKPGHWTSKSSSERIHALQSARWVERRTGTDRRKTDELGFLWYRSGKERRAPAAPDDTCPSWCVHHDEQRDAKAERWYERHYPSGVSDPAGFDFHTIGTARRDYHATLNAGGCYDITDRPTVHDDNEQAEIDFVASILQAEIDRDFLARAQHPSHRRDEHEHGGLGVLAVQGERWGLFHRWGRALRRRLPVRGFNVASPGLQWGSESSPARDPRRGGIGFVPLGPEVHGESVVSLANGACLPSLVSDETA